MPFITLTYSHELEPEVAPTPSSVPSLLSSSNVGQVSISGVRPSWTDVRVDGMDANDPVFRYSPAGHPRALSGIERIHGFTEIRILAQTFNVEYGRNGGSVIDTVTKSSRCCRQRSKIPRRGIVRVS